MSATGDKNVSAEPLAAHAKLPPVARIQDLRVSFRTSQGMVHALRSVSLDIEAGEVLALVGESGSGKSVLGQSLLGLSARIPGAEISGSVSVAGVDMLGVGEADRRAVRRHLLGAVFQDPLTSLNPTMKIGRQLTERGITEERALNNLRDAGVPDPADRARQFPHELSGGLRQRVSIAMALGATPGGSPGGEVEVAGTQVLTGADGSPRLIVADEPTTALDVSVQAQVVLLFDRLRREHGSAILFVTHDLGVAASIADRIAVLYAGRVCEVGPVRQMLASPTHWYTKALLAARVSADTDRNTPILAIPGSPPNPLELPPGCAFAPRCPNVQEDCLGQLPELCPWPHDGGRGAAACLHPRPLTEEAELVADVAEAPGELGSVEAAAEERRAESRQATDREPALSLVNVFKTFTVRGGRLGRGLKLHAVSNVSLSVRQSGSLALVGESGCGKTTTLRIACGLIDADEGEVKWASGAGRPQLVFQDAGSSLTPWMSVGTMLSEQLRRRGIERPRRRAETVELLERVGLDSRAIDARARDLSGGQRQRAAIARALASEPRLLICDEPVSALDASLAIRVLDLLEELRRDLGVAILMVTHDLGVAKRIADQLAVMYRGEIVEQGQLEAIFAEPAHPYTEGLLAAIPTTEPGRLSPKLAGEPPSPVGEVQGCPFAPRCPLAQDRCRVEKPLLRAVGAGRESACHYAEQVLGHRAARTAP